MNCYAVLLALSLLAWTTQAEDTYSDKFDYINVDEILANDRLRNQYYKCFMDMEPCVTADAQFFKEHLPEAFATKCNKCTDMQKVFFDKVADWYTKNEAEEWKALVEKTLNNAKQKHAAS